MEGIRIIIGLVASIESWYMATDVLHSVLVDGRTLIGAFGHAASSFGRHALMPIIKTIVALPVALVKLLVQLVLSVFQIPIDIVWALVPGLSNVPTPNIAAVIMDNATKTGSDE